MKNGLKLSILGAALVLGACGGASQSAPPATAAPAQPAATQAAAPAATGFGVAECDDYMTKYLACIDTKVPEAARAMVRQQVDATKDAWQKAAATPEGRTGLVTACKAATDAAKTSMAAYGCTF